MLFEYFRLYSIPQQLVNIHSKLFYHQKSIIWETSCTSHSEPIDVNKWNYPTTFARKQHSMNHKYAALARYKSSIWKPHPTENQSESDFGAAIQSIRRRRSLDCCVSKLSVCSSLVQFTWRNCHSLRSFSINISVVCSITTNKTFISNKQINKNQAIIFPDFSSHEDQVPVFNATMKLNRHFKNQINEHFMDRTPRFWTIILHAGLLFGIYEIPHEAHQDQPMREATTNLRADNRTASSLPSYSWIFRVEG